MKQPLEYKMTIPNMIRVLSKSKEEYKRWVILYFKSVHPDMKITRIEKGFAIMVKQT